MWFAEERRHDFRAAVVGHIGEVGFGEQLHHVGVVEALGRKRAGAGEAVLAAFGLGLVHEILHAGDAGIGTDAPAHREDVDLRHRGQILIGEAALLVLRDDGQHVGRGEADGIAVGTGADGFERGGDAAAAGLAGDEQRDVVLALQVVADNTGGGVGGVARAEGFEHHGPQPRSREHGPQDLLAHSREEFDQLDASGELRGDAQFRRRLFGLQDRREVVGDVDADFGQRRVVVGTEGAQGFGAAFGGAVGAEKPVLEIERHFGDLGPVADARSGDFDGRDEVLAPVGAQHADRNLASGEDHGFGEIFEHEAQGRCRIGHGVGSVQHDEPVVIVVGFHDRIPDAHPIRRTHVGAVYVHQLDGVDFTVASAVGHIGQDFIRCDDGLKPFIRALAGNGAACSE